MTLPNRNSPAEATAASLLQGLRRALPALLIIALAAGMVTFGVFSVLKPKASAEVQLRFGQADPSASGGDATRLEGAAKSGVGQADATPLAQHAMAIGSRPILRAVAEKLKLQSRPEFNGSGSSEFPASLLRLFGFGDGKRGARQLAVVEAIRNGLTIIAHEDRAAVTIRYEGSDAATATRFVNTLADVYRRHLAEAPAAASRREIEKLSSTLAAFRSELARSEGELEKLRAEAQAAKVEDPRLVELKQRLAKAEEERRRAESNWQAALQLPNSADPAASGAVRSSEALRAVLQRRDRARQRLAQAEKTLLPAHPRLQRLRREAAKLERAYKGELARQTKVLEHAFRTAVLRLEDIRREIASVVAKSVKPSVDSSRLTALEAEVDTKRSQLQDLEIRLGESRAKAVEFRPVQAEVVGPTRAAGGQPASRKVRYTLIAMMGAFMVGCAFVLTRESISKPSRLPEPDLEEVFGDETAEPIAAPADALPSLDDVVREVPSDNPLITEEPSEDEFAQAALHDFPAIDGIFEYLLARGREVNGLRSMLVGEWQGIDPSEEALELVHRLSQAGAQVILVDWSPARDGLTQSFDVNDRPGISELMRGQATFEDAVTNIPNTRVHHMSAGLAMNLDLVGKGGAFGADSECLNMILDALDEVYDHIVVVARYNDAMKLFEAIEGRFDAGIIVCESQARRAAPQDDDNTFLGFEVADIDIVRFCRTIPNAVTEQRPTHSESTSVYA